MKYWTVRGCFRWMMLTTTLMGGGCAAFRPIEGVPARYLAPEYLAVPRSNESTIDLSLLTQSPPPQHLVDGGDVLGIYIEGVLGRPGEAPPITVPITPDLPPAIGYPITVRDDGTLSLPMIGSVNVRGKTIRQVEEQLRTLYTTERQILRAGQDRIIVSLQRPRQVRVLVLRQETGGPGGNEFAQGLSINLGQTKRGNGQTVDLPIYKNDVLHALARTGGLPGLDAENTIYVIRRQAALAQTENCPPGTQLPPTPYAPQQAPYVPSPSFQPAPQGPLMAPGYQSSAVPAPKAANGIQQVSYQQPAGTNVAPAQGFRTHGSRPSPSQSIAQQFAEIDEIHSEQAVTATRLPSQTIKPVHASGFGSQDPLAELRLGMQSASVDSTGVDSFSVHSSGVDSTPEVHSSRMVFDDFSEQPSSPQLLSGAQHAHAEFQQAQYQTSNLSPGQPQPWQVQPEQYQPSPYQSEQYPPYLSSAGTIITPEAGANTACPSQWPALGDDNSSYYVPGQQPPQRQSAQTWDTLAGEIHPAMQNYSQEMWPMENQDWMQAFNGNDPTMNKQSIVKIPVRLKPGEQPHISREDVILQDGDIVFIESRETEIFYTAGLLGGGQYTLPRDYDLDVLGAISIAQAANQQQSPRQLGGVAAINGDVTISASSVIILRPTEDGGQISIKVDLYRALKDPSERVLIKPGDIVMLRYKTHEAIGAFIERNLLESALFGLAASQMNQGRN